MSCDRAIARAGWCWAPSWVVVELAVLRLIGWSLGSFCLKNQSQKSPSPLVCTLCGCSVAQECVGYRPTTTQPPITAQLARRWVVLGGLKTTQTSSDLVDQARAALASSGLVWAVKKPPNTTQHHQLRPGLARAARAAWPCLYVDTNNPNRPARSWCAQLADQVATRCTRSKGICTAWSRVYGRSMSAPGREYVAASM